VRWFLAVIVLTTLIALGGFAISWLGECSRKPDSAPAGGLHRIVTSLHPGFGKAGGVCSFCTDNAIRLAVWAESGTL
jgi:hypothetical protein